MELKRKMIRVAREYDDNAFFKQFLSKTEKMANTDLHKCIMSVLKLRKDCCKDLPFM